MDARRAIPSTTVVLADPAVGAAGQGLARAAVVAAIRVAQAAARAGEIEPEQVTERAVALLATPAATLRPVINATGVVLHTNLGRAPLSPDACAALLAAAGTVDVEWDAATGARAGRGRQALAALLVAVPAAEAALVVNNGAAAILLAVAGLAGGRAALLSRGEFVEIGDGFRVPELLRHGGVELREVGTTNRTALADYAGALADDTAAILKIHPSNFVVRGFTSSVGVGELAGLGPPVIVDAGSGLLAPHPLLPGELDVTSALRAGAAVVTCSADKLLGGPQAGLILGPRRHVDVLRRHPLYRALRVDKLTLAALEATLRGSQTPTWIALTAAPAEIEQRCRTLAAQLSEAGAEVVGCRTAIGGGSAPDITLPSWAVSLPERYAEPLRRGHPAIAGRIEAGHLLLDLRTVDPAHLPGIADRVRTLAGQQ
ncbi:MAG TPA: L-seryl-tRNA(Sec) selenium transferase [Mycobacteriales bacterium]|nr:L-seryl-tRNA(Sec) selenium transferase [Mycobacteriales bacterium]